jgi:hypothetical protein
MPHELAGNLGGVVENVRKFNASPETRKNAAAINGNRLNCMKYI